MKTSAPPQETKVKAKRRHYDERFKRDAVALLEGGGVPPSWPANWAQWNLRDWKQRYGAGGPAGSLAAAASTVALAMQLADLRREFAAVTGQRDLLKSLGHCCPGAAARYALIDQLRLDHPAMKLREACTTLAVSPSGYYAHQHKARRPRRAEDAALALKISAAFAASRRTYGSPRLRAGACHGQNRIARLMRQQGLRVRPKRRFVPRTTVAAPDAPVVPNRLLQCPALTRLNEVWLTDITYLPTAEGFLYLAAEMDL